MSDKTRKALDLMAATVMKHGGGFRIVGRRFFVLEGHNWEGCTTITVNGRQYVETSSFSELFQALGY
jgi:hypothetical protein